MTNIQKLMSSGFLSEDPEAIYSTVASLSGCRRYLIQEDSDDIMSRQFWSAKTDLQPWQYLNKIKSEFPRAVIIKNKPA